MYYLTGKRYEIQGGKFLEPTYYGYDRPGGTQKLGFECDTEWYFADECTYEGKKWWFLCDDIYRFFYVPDVDIDYYKFVGEHIETKNKILSNNKLKATEPLFYNDSNKVGFPGYSGDYKEYRYIKPISITFHNTGDFYSRGVMNSRSYSSYYEQQFNAGKEPAIAHYYVDGLTITQMIDDSLSSWGNGCGQVNQKYYSIEICDNWYNLFTPEQYFRLAEENSFWFAAKLIREKNLSINDIKLHYENANECGSGTECPKRSQSIYGIGLETKNYFKGRVQYYYDNPSALPDVIDVPESLEGSFTGQRYEIQGGKFLEPTYYGYDRPGGTQKLGFECDTGWYFADECYYNGERWWGLCDDTYRFFYVPDVDINYYNYVGHHIEGVTS